MNSGSCTVLAAVAFKSTGRLKPWQLRTAKRMVLDHLDTGISVTELAQACGLSRSHFTRMFKESTQVPPQKWMREQRISKSKELLAASSRVLAEIALECGFYDQAHFCRTFMKTEGMTPLAWQQLYSRGATAAKNQGHSLIQSISHLGSSSISQRTIPISVRSLDGFATVVVRAAIRPPHRPPFP